jgi:hypothetical protein
MKNNQKPDFSQYVVHFTKDASTISAADETDPTLKGISEQTASQRLMSMLTERRIRATRMPWTKRPAICFTESTWGGLLHHSMQYSPFGVGFSKAFLFSRGGGPAIYMTPGLLEHQKNHAGEGNLPFDPHVYAFLTPFMPAYAPKAYKDKFWRRDKPIDYTHEREWRVPHDLDFDHSDVAFIIVNRYEDMAAADKKLKDAISRDKWIIMENYKKIEELWPTHHLPQ